MKCLRNRPRTTNRLLKTPEAEIRGSMEHLLEASQLVIITQSLQKMVSL